MPSALAELRTHPFALLLEIERRARLAAAGQRQGGELEAEWVGVGFRLGGHLFVTPRDEVREILAYTGGITRVPGAKKWLRGLANIRGQLLPIIDLNAFLGGEATPQSRNMRIVAVNHASIPAGLMVDEVRGFRRFTTGERTEQAPETGPGFVPYLSGAFQRGEELWGILSLQTLVGSQAFLQAAE